MAITNYVKGSLVSSGFDLTNTFNIYMVDFVESTWLTKLMFNNADNEMFWQNGGGERIKFSQVAKVNKGMITNLASYPRCNIVHRNVDDRSTFLYDGCYYTYTYENFGDESYKLKLYTQDTLVYTLDPTEYLYYLTKDKITSIYLVINDNTVRPMFVDNDGNCYIFKIIPQMVFDEWGKEREDDTRPSPDYTKDPTDSYNADGWQNSFEIMRGGPYVENFKLLKDMSSSEDVNIYWDNVGGDSDLHFFGSTLADVTGYLGTSTGATEYNNAIQTAYTMTPATLGSTLYSYYKLSDTDKKFVHGSRRIDGNITYTNLPTSNNEININRNNNNVSIKWNYTTLQDTSVLEYLTIDTRISGEIHSYTYNGSMGKIDRGGGEYYSLGVWVTDVWIFCIPKSSTIPPEISGFYLVGWTNVGVAGNNVKGNFVAIDKLDDLHLDEIFDDWSPDEPPEEEKFTEILIEDELGGETGTGEMLDEPIDISTNENKHDGTLGNGTGSVHEGDTKIPDPENDLPLAGQEGSALGSGMIKVYTPTKTQLELFAGELLSDSVIDALKDYFTTNPMDGIIGLSMLPYTGFSSTSTSKPKIGTHGFDTDINLAGKEYLTVDYGTVDVKFAYDGYENYSQYSDCKIFLPHIGYKELDIDMIQGCRIHLKYTVSLVTGDIYAYLYAKWVSGKDKGANNIEHLLYHWQGNCNMTVPVTHVDKSSYVNGAIQAAGNIASIVSGGLTMNSLAGQMTMAESTGEYAALNKQFEGAGLSVGRNISGLGSSVASMFKPSITTSGNISGACAYMSERTPYLLLSRPVIISAQDIRHHYGLVTTKKYSIPELKGKGYTELSNIDLNGVGATSDEMKELKSIMESGFYA